MNKILTYLILFIVVAAAGCGDEITESQKQEIIDSRIKELTDVRVKKFDVTECQRDCQRETGKIINQSLDSDVLNLEIGHWTNCATSVDNNMAGFEYENGFLNLFIKSKPVGFEIKENGDTSFYAEAEACSCYFIFNFELSGFQEIPDSITINNNPIDNYLGMFEGLILNGDTIGDTK